MGRRRRRQPATAAAITTTTTTEAIPATSSSVATSSSAGGNGGDDGPPTLASDKTVAPGQGTSSSVEGDGGAASVVSSARLRDSYLIASPATDDVRLAWSGKDSLLLGGRTNKSIVNSQSSSKPSSPWRIFLGFYALFSTTTLYFVLLQPEQVQVWVKAYLRYTSLPLALFVYGAEPLLLVLQVLLYTHPAAVYMDDEDETEIEDFDHPHHALPPPSGELIEAKKKNNDWKVEKGALNEYREEAQREEEKKQEDEDDNERHDDDRDSELEELVQRSVKVPSPHDASTLLAGSSARTATVREEMNGASAGLESPSSSSAASMPSWTSFPSSMNDEQVKSTQYNMTQQHPETPHMAVVIATHHTPVDIVLYTVWSCLRFVRPEQIYVVENDTVASSRHSSDIRDALQNADLHDVNYLYNPYANKVLAIYAGCLAATKRSAGGSANGSRDGDDGASPKPSSKRRLEKHATEVRQILILDDDVTLPDDMYFGTNLIRDRCRAVCYPIRPVHPHNFNLSKEFPMPTTSFLVEWQYVEYQASDYAKLLQSAVGTCSYPHGAVSLWDADTLIECCRQHDTVFYADDLKMGWWLQTQGYELCMVPQSVVATAAPTAWFWNDTAISTTTLFRQRVCSWDMAEHIYHGEAFSMLWRAQFDNCGTAAVLRLWHLWACWTLIADWIRIPVTLLTVAWNAKAFGIWMMVIGFVYTAFLVMWDSIAYRRVPARRCDSLALLSFQIYRWIMLAFRSAGMMRAFVWYLPCFVRPPTIPELESEEFFIDDDDDEDDEEAYAERYGSPGNEGLRLRRPVWMNPENPYFTNHQVSVATADPPAPTWP